MQEETSALVWWKHQVLGVTTLLCVAREHCLEVVETARILES